MIIRVIYVRGEPHYEVTHNGVTLCCDYNDVDLKETIKEIMNE